MSSAIEAGERHSEGASTWGQSQDEPWQVGEMAHSATVTSLEWYRGPAR